MQPKIPTVAGGSHVNAKKSNVAAANDRQSATMNNGRQNTDDDRVDDLLRARVLGS